VSWQGFCTERERRAGWDYVTLASWPLREREAGWHDVGWLAAAGLFGRFGWLENVGWLAAAGCGGRAGFGRKTQQLLKQLFGNGVNQRSSVEVVIGRWLFQTFVAATSEVGIAALALPATEHMVQVRVDKFVSASTIVRHNASIGSAHQTPTLTTGSKKITTKPPATYAATTTGVGTTKSDQLVAIRPANTERR
jgi:hypothetical protein